MKIDYDKEESQEAVDYMTADLETMSEEELHNMKKFLFEERIRVIQEQEKQKELYEKFLRERLTFQDEMKTLNSKVLAERKRLKEENLFFDKKMQILQNGFLQLDLDRKKFEKERSRFEAQKKFYGEDEFSRTSYAYNFDSIRKIIIKINASKFFK